MDGRKKERKWSTDSVAMVLLMIHLIYVCRSANTKAPPPVQSVIHKSGELRCKPPVPAGYTGEVRLHVHESFGTPAPWQHGN